MQLYYVVLKIINTAKVFKIFENSLSFDLQVDNRRCILTKK